MCAGLHNIHNLQCLPTWCNQARQAFGTDCDEAHLSSSVLKQYTKHVVLQGGIGPMQGQAAHFVKFAPEKIDYGIKRYTNETRRLYGVIEKALSDGRQWLAAGEYTIADMANFSWMFVHQMAGKTHSLALSFVSDCSVC